MTEYQADAAPHAHWRIMTIRKAIALVSRMPERITSIRQLENIKGIGDKTLAKIQEILDTGQLQRVEILKRSERNQTLNLFCGIWGVGLKTATKFFSLGMRTLTDLERRPDLLNRNQRVGLAYYHEFKQRIPRSEVDVVVEKVREVAASLLPHVEIVCAGSYRRFSLLLLVLVLVFFFFFFSWALFGRSFVGVQKHAATWTS
eukprot:TRINITY_DN2232_c0_g1_i10.p2 TRINITY_DN2232_c0_g1~~TRINITY_DN2232_c0_g1_i10.p2  ORF type:complete len:202 (-),score=48.63 TRINITY_DN2232_c0_g1_i10:463-1068(-)